MADIFISYKKEDQARIRPLVTALEAEGYSVWWDQNIDAGDDWFRRILAELKAAKLTIGVWSLASVDDQGLFRPNKKGLYYVKIEHEQTAQGKLLPVMLDDGRTPLEFSHVQAVDLSDWTGDRASADWLRLLARVRAVVGVSSPRAATATPQSAPRPANHDRPAVRQVAGVSSPRAPATAPHGVMYWVIHALIPVGVLVFITGPSGQSGPSPQQSFGILMTMSGMALLPSASYFAAATRRSFLSWLLVSLTTYASMALCFQFLIIPLTRFLNWVPEQLGAIGIAAVMFVLAKYLPGILLLTRWV